MPLGDVARLGVQIDLTGDLDKGVVKASKDLTGLAKATAKTEADAKKSAAAFDKLAQEAKEAGFELKKDPSAGMRKLQEQAKRAGYELEKTGRGTSRLGKALSGLKGNLLTGLGLGAGFAAFNLIAQAITTVVDFMKEAQAASSDLAEQQSKLGAVFSDSAQELREWSETASTSMGLSQRAALEAAGTFGNFLQAMKLTEEQSADMSKEMVQLSADLASFNNTAGGSEEVLEAIAAGLRGETEPMMRYGVVLLETNVKQKMLQMGMKATSGVFTDAQKVMARHALIMEKTAKAQGDFARTGTSSANMARTLAGRTEDVQAKMGRFADNVTKVAQGLAIDLVNALDDAADHFHTLERLMSPHLALQEDITKALIAEVEARGMSSKGIEEFVKQQYALAESTKRTAEQEERLAVLNKTLKDDLDFYLQYRPDLLESLTAERDALMGVSTATDGNTQALSLNAEGQAKYIAFLTEFLKLTPEQIKLLTATTGATEGLTGATGEQTVAVKKVTRATIDMGQATAIATTKYGEERKSIRKLIANVRDLRHERDLSVQRFLKNSQDIEDLSNQQARAFRKGRLREAAAIQLVIDRLEEQREAITATMALMTKVLVGRGLKGFVGDLFGNFNRRSGGNKNQGQFATGGVMYPGDYGTVGERGMERVSNKGGVTVIEPMGGRSMAQTINVTVRPLIPAYEVNRELGRIGTTRRSGAGVL
jgi:hypothetical protein